MFPDNSQNQQNVPVNLPSVTAAGQPQQPQQAVPVPPSAPIGGGDVSAHYATQAKRAVGQYANDPYKLALALSQLKSAYISEQYHITSNQTGN